MQALDKKVYEARSLSNISFNSLYDLYDGTVEELRICSLIAPGEGSEDSEIDHREAALLEFENILVDRASRMPLKSSEDITNMIDIWAKVSGVHSESDIRQSDKIAMNIFRHLSSHLI